MGPTRAYANFSLMTQIEITESDGQLSDLVARVEAGEAIILARAGRPVVRIEPVAPEATLGKHRFIGAWAHLGPFSDEFLDSFLGPDPDFDPDKDELF
ncbi:type II toxin-antitoxin system prevent-host-death family antitoxin [Brevundimonas sp.]|uniref:type II toxin-antitoxin system Phd/YefM family antitoxin n=1 Tax=Brevundimonas sp. TaxID=1871086 RepID=UPI002ABB7F0E|nr:type II toxin-antitoxin system prevent-host-death family antitoxin [Brevundimonas sp.]MDZ4363231.1 type II toxin-antitoxin system prevent-host-death family antitoxin [Brevundimonas sp.]